MDTIKARLGKIDGGRVLDLATGSGGFAARLASELASYEELVAVDSAQRAVDAAARNLAETRAARAELADASALPYPDASFGLVGISNSLHHFPAPAKALAEAVRVLFPGGRLVVIEMHSEAKDKAAMTHVLLHHWWGDVDRAGGVYHAQTFSREGIRVLLGLEGIEPESWDEIPAEGEDPFDADTLAEIGKAVESYRGKIAALPASVGEAERASLLARGEELLERARTQGFRSAPSVLFIGRKRA